MPPFSIQPTPNPNSLKFAATGTPFLDGGMLACASADEAQAHPLSAALFEVEGVFNVLVLPAFATVTKRPEADWNTMLPRIEQILTAHLEGEA